MERAYIPSFPDLHYIDCAAIPAVGDVVNIKFPQEATGTRDGSYQVLGEGSASPKPNIMVKYLGQYKHGSNIYQAFLAY
jgi:hypothetical protein